MTLPESEKRQDRREKPLTKVIIRRLPPMMPKEQFLDQVSPLPDYNYMYYVKGDVSLGENSFSRAYINFVCPDDVYSFKDKFDNYVFVDSKGHEYPAVVEFAPFQKIPKKRGKNRMDPKCNTIEADPCYLEFLANLNKPAEPNEKPEYTLQLGEREEDKKKDITTPLLEFIKNKRAQKMKIREVRREERERRRKEFDKRKEHNKYYDDRKYDEKSPAKPYGKKPYSKSSKIEPVLKESNLKPENDDKPNQSYKNKKEDKQSDKQSPLSPETKPKKMEDKKEKKEIKPRFPKKEFGDPSREYTKREDYSHRDYRLKNFEDHKKDENTKSYPKKIKKYSERREERKIEAQKAEQRKLELMAKEKEISTPSEVDNTQETQKPNEKDFKKPDEISEKETTAFTKQPSSEKEGDNERKNNEKGESSSKRIRNKDRPTIPLYRPGMLSKRKQPENEDPPDK